MRAISKNCEKHGHPEFSVCAVENHLAVQLSWLFAWLESEVAAGKRFLPDQTVQVGWSLLKVFQREDGTLGLLEPDFKNMPVVFIESVSHSLFHMLVQKSVAESLQLGNELNLPPLQHHAIACNRAGTSTEIFLSRVTPSGNDSGWFFGCCDNEHNHQTPENLRRLSLYEAVISLDRRIVEYLGLPSGIAIHLRDSGASFSKNGKPLKILAGSYLQERLLRSS